MNSLKILYAVPSHKRPDRVLTLKMFPDCIVFVPESQLEDYKKYIPEEKLVSHPDTIIGLTPKLNWILDYARENGYDVMHKFDDDFIMGKWAFGTSEKLTTEEIRELTENLIQMAIDMGTPLYTCLETIDIRKTKANQPFEFFSPIRTGYYGLVLKGFEPIHYDERFVLKQDFDIALQVMHKYGRMIVDKRFGFVMDKVGGNKGGCAMYRTSDKEMESIKMLKKKWGSHLFNTSQSKRFGKFTINAKNPLFDWDS